MRTYTVNKALAVGESFYPATDRISGSTDSPTDTVIDRLHILAPVPKGLADLEMTAKICP